MPEIKEMSIHRGLSELKTLGARIAKATNETVLVLAKRKEDVEIAGFPVEDYKKLMQASHDKVLSLIAYRNNIKSAIVQSNATTIVEVGGVKMTVAEAIERKDSILYKQELLGKLRRQYADELRSYEAQKAALPSKLESYLVNILGSKEKAKADEVETYTNTFLRRNEFELYDPFSVKNIIDKLQEEVDTFITEVDTVLSESNAITRIQVEVQ